MSQELKMHGQKVVLVKADTEPTHDSVPFIGTETGIIGIMLSCVVVLIALGQLLTGEDG